MDDRHEVNWQPLSMVPTISDMVADALADSREHILTLMAALDRPYSLADEDLDRSRRVYTEQLEFVAIYTGQITRWRAVELSPNQRQIIDRIDADNAELLPLTWQVLALVETLRGSTIEAMMKMTDLELGLDAVVRGKANL
jgi:hypothetical protein